MESPSHRGQTRPSVAAAPLQTVPRRTRGIHAFLKVVRSVYRAQHRKPQFEAVYVEWVERFLRRHPGVPFEQLTRADVTAFLAESVAQPDVAPRDERAAREALHFLWTEVLSRC